MCKRLENRQVSAEEDLGTLSQGSADKKAERPMSSLYREAGTSRLNPQLEFGCAASCKVTLKYSGVEKQPGLKSCLRKGPIPSKQYSNQVDLPT